MGNRSVCGGQCLERPSIERQDDKWTKCRDEKFQFTNYRKKVLNRQNAERKKRRTQSSHTIVNYILLYLQFPQK